LVVWLAYPIPLPEPPSWAAHWAPVEQAASSTPSTLRIPLSATIEADVHIMACR
jgi:hypothetical protein